MTIRPQFDHHHYRPRQNEPFVVDNDINEQQKASSPNDASYSTFPANSTKLRSILCQKCNLGYSSEVYQRKFPLTILSLNGKCFDHLIIARGLLQYALSYKVKYTDPIDGKVYEKPLLKGSPRFIFRSINEIYGFQIQFECWYGKDCVCRIGKDKRNDMRLRGEYTPTCPFERRCVFKDVLLFTNTSLQGMIDDLHLVREKEGMSLKQTFPNCYKYCKRWGYDEQSIATILSCKMHMPYELLSSFQLAESITEPPEARSFKSILRNNHIGLSPDQHREFVTTWNVLKVQNMGQLLKIYNILDTLFLADAGNFYFSKLHEVTKLWCTHTFTISSFSVFSSLYNSKSPENRKKRLFLPFMNSKIYSYFQKELTGGLASSQARFFESTWGMVDQQEVSGTNGYMDIPEAITQQVTFDFNGLYSSILTATLPYKNYLLHMADHPSIFHRRVVKALETLDIDFFHDLAMEHDTGLFIECTVDFDKKQSLKTGIDLGMFPLLTKVNPEVDLPKDQRDWAEKAGRSLKNDQPKLISDMAEGRNFHFIHNLLFLVVHQSVRIVQVHDIISFTQAAYLRPYMGYLGECRNKTKSKVMQKIIKSLGNSLSGD